MRAAPVPGSGGEAQAAAYAVAGEPARAAEVARRALALANSTGQLALVEAIEQRLQLYEAGQAYVEEGLD